MFCRIMKGLRVHTVFTSACPLRCVSNLRHLIPSSLSCFLLWVINTVVYSTWTQPPSLNTCIIARAPDLTPYFPDVSSLVYVLRTVNSVKGMGFAETKNLTL